jgi:epoxyqueuosine reductase
MNGVVNIEKCLRHHIPVHSNLPDNIKMLSRRSYIGCGVCQLVCPLNAKIQKVAPPDDLVNALDILGILSNNKEQIKKLGDIIGKNSARPGRLIATACLAAGYTHDKRYLPKLKKLSENHPNPLVKDYANWAINQIDN